MSKVIFDHFELTPTSFETVCDSSLNPNTVRERVAEYNERFPVEQVYRTLYNFGIIAPESKYVKLFRKFGNTVFFALDVEKLKKEHSNIFDKLSPIFKGNALEYWKNLTN